MIFQYILSEILHKLQNERSVSAPYYILKGKRSGHSIQDVGMYHLYHYFSILPKLSKKVYDDHINGLIKRGILLQHSNGTFTIKNEEIKNNSNLFFDGWHYRGNEHIFFARLSLIVQTLSHKKNDAMKFTPIQKNERVQKWVRQFLILNQYNDGRLNEQLHSEIVESFQHLKCEVKSKNIVINRLSGFNIPGFTWGQLAKNEEMEELDIQLLYISFLHEWLNEIYMNARKYPILSSISEGIRYVQPLSGSTAQTAKLFYEGYSIEQISTIRNIKVSTVEDHIVEMALNDKQFNISQFISEVDIQQVISISKKMKTKKLKVIHEAIPQLSYFQLRLALARGEQD